ncbi:hypothetical protein [Pseudonocardia dioxanivorans]|jgi:hypothetical protein|nr:hypothetical protein PSD17_25060 [Pseudonocardia sp. D17]
MDDSDLAVPVVAARAARLGRNLDPKETEELAAAVASNEATYQVLRARPVRLMSGRTDHALGDAWLRPGALDSSVPDSNSDGEQ